MKKSKLLLVFSCVGLLGITACDNQAPSSSSSLPPEPPVVRTDTITFSDDKLITDALIETNSEPKEEVENRKVKNVVTPAEKESFKEEDILNDEYEGHGLLVVKNEQGYVGFYSLLHHGWLIKPSFEQGKFSYRVRELPYIEYILEIHYRDNYVILDAFGNILDAERQFSTQKAEYYYNPVAGEYSDHSHFKMKEADQAFLSVKLINEKPVLMLPFEEEEEHEEVKEDEYGNIVYEKDEEGEYIRDEDGQRIPEMETIVEKFVTGYFFEYESDGTVSVLMDEYGQGFAHGWPEQEEEEEEEEEDEELKLGDFYTNNLEDLADKGLPGYYLARSGDANNVYTVYDGTGKVKCSFAVQSSVGAHPLIQEYGIIGSKMVFQAFEQVADDSDDYDVFIRDLNPTAYNPHSGAKYVCESFTYNLLTGERLDFEKGFYFLGKITPVIGAGNGEYLYAVNISLVNDSRTLDAAKTYLVDKNFVAHDNITGFEFYSGNELHPFNLLELQDGKFYDQSQRVIYNSKLEPIAHLKGISNLEYLPEHNVFIAKYNDKWGLIDTNGKVAAEFKYDSINLKSGISGRFLAYIDHDLYIVGAGKAPTQAGYVYDEDEQYMLQPFGNNGIYLMVRGYKDSQQTMKYEAEIFDTQSVDAQGNYKPLAEIRALSSIKVRTQEYDHQQEKLVDKTYTVDLVSDGYDYYDNLLGQYSLFVAVNCDNEYTIETVDVLDEYKDPIKDEEGNVITEQQLKEAWVYNYTVVAPSNLKLTSYDSGEEALDAFYEAKDKETAQVLSLEANEVLKRESGLTYLSFTPEEDGPFLFTANPEAMLNDGLGAVTEEWEEPAVVTHLFARYDEAEVNANKGTLKLTVELKESEENGEEAQEKTYKPEKVDLKDIILHKVYNDKNEAQLKNLNSHMEISFDDLVVYRWEELPLAEDAPEDAEPEHAWVKYEGSEVSLAELGTVDFKLVLKGTEPEDEKEEDKSIYFLLKIQAKEAPAQQPAPAQQDEEEEEKWDPEKLFHMIKSEDEMFLNKKSKTLTMKVTTNYEEDEEGEKVAVSKDFYFGASTFEGIGDDEWTEGYLKAGHTYYFTLKSTGKTQVNGIEVKKSHVHKVSEWLMADMAIPTGDSVDNLFQYGFKLGICERGEEIVSRNANLTRSAETLSLEEAKEFLANLGKDLSSAYAIDAKITTTWVKQEDDTHKQTTSGAFYVLEGKFTEEVEKYNEKAKEGDPKMVEKTAEEIAALVAAQRLPAEEFEKFLLDAKYHPEPNQGEEQQGEDQAPAGDQEQAGDEEQQGGITWNKAKLYYLYDKDLDKTEKGEDDKEVVVHQKSYYTIGAQGVDADGEKVLYVGIFNAEGLLLYGQMIKGFASYDAASIANCDSATIIMGIFYTEEFAEFLLENPGIMGGLA